MTDHDRPAGADRTASSYRPSSYYRSGRATDSSSANPASSASSATRASSATSATSATRATRAAGSARSSRATRVSSASDASGAPSTTGAATRPYRSERPRGRRLRLGDPRRRSTALLAGLLMVLTVFAGRLLDLQAVKGDALAAAAVGQRLRTVTLPAERGSITDVHGSALATTVEAVNITADQTLVKEPSAVAAQLAKLLKTDAAALTERLTGTRRFVYIAKGITPELWRQIKAARLSGIFSERTTVRTYPAAELAANVVGFVDAAGKGKGGMELALQRLLKGTDGRSTYESGMAGNAIPSARDRQVDPVRGTDVRLTIDRDIQFVAQQEVAARVKYAKADSGNVVVLDTVTGAVVALATAPTFDPNKPAESVTANRYNRALSEVFEPGSTSKVMTMAAVVEEGAANLLTPITVPPTLRVGGKTFHDHDSHPTLHLTLNGVLAKSSNIGTILAAQRIGPDKLYEYLKKFGIAEFTGLNFPAEARGLLAPPEKWSGTSFPTIAFGQGLAVNAVQAANVFATIANDGVRISPSLVASYTKPDGTVVRAAPGARSRVVSTATARTVRTMLESVVSDQGTAPMAAIPGYRVAGKTGTAQNVDPACGCYRGYVASFIGLAPADKPRLVVAVSLNNPRNGHYGGVLGAPVFTKVMSYALQAMRIPPTGTVAPRLPVSLDRG